MIGVINNCVRSVCACTHNTHTHTHTHARTHKFVQKILFW